MQPLGGWAFHRFHPVDSAGQDVDRWARQLDGGSLATGLRLDIFQDDHSLEAIQISIDFYRNIQKHHENLSFGVPHFVGNFFHDHRT